MPETKCLVESVLNLHALNHNLMANFVPFVPHCCSAPHVKSPLPPENDCCWSSPQEINTSTFVPNAGHPRGKRQTKIKPTRNCSCLNIRPVPALIPDCVMNGSLSVGRQGQGRPANYRESRSSGMGSPSIFMIRRAFVVGQGPGFK